VENAPAGDQLAVLLLVAARLDRAGIPYMLSGSMAMNYYAQPRMTRDIDVVVELTEGSADSFSEEFAEDFYCDRDAIRAAVRRRELFNLIHLERLVKVDFVVRKDTPYRRQEFARRRPVTVEGRSIWLVTAEDLLLSKLAWAKDSRSQVQLEDARNLVESVPDLDQGYLARWAAELTVTELLAEVRG
jgi:hypothetical protein